jgi:exoribonuclease II
MSNRFPDEICRRLWAYEVDLIWQEELQRKLDQIKSYARPRARLTTVSVMSKARTAWRDQPFTFYFEMSDYLEAWANGNTSTITVDQRRALSNLIRETVIYILRKMESPNPM